MSEPSIYLALAGGGGIIGCLGTLYAVANNFVKKPDCEKAQERCPIGVKLDSVIHSLDELKGTVKDIHKEIFRADR